MNPVSQPPSAAKRVLVVDDEESVRIALQATLEVEGFEVVSAPDAATGLEYVRHQAFGVVISDQRMLEIDGLEFLKAVRGIQPHSTRLMLSGFADVDLMVRAINDGQVYRFLLKPWVHQELVHAVQDAAYEYQTTCLEVKLELDAQVVSEELKRSNAALAAELKQGRVRLAELERLNRALHENVQRSVELCLHALQTFHYDLGVTARRVQALCVAMANDLKLPVEQRRVFEIGALLHDIGFLAVHPDLIHRWQQDPASLNESEQFIIRQHPIIGQELATFAEDLKDVGPLIRAHHERYDGQGYPDRLRGEEIPWLAQLLAVAVAYVWHQHAGGDAVAMITAARGTEFDPEAVRVLMRSLPQAVLPRAEKGLLLSELKPGMVLASPIYNSQGMLIMPGGRPLSEAWIAKLKAHDRISPLNEYFQVCA